MSIRHAAGSGFRWSVRSALVVAAWVCLPAWADSNLVTNSSFESGLAGWSSSGDVAWASGSASDGVAAAVLATADASITWTLATAVAVADITDFSLAVQNANGALNLVVLNYADGSSSGTDLMLFDLGNADWTRYSLADALAAGKSLLGFTLFGSSSGATLVDDVRLTTVSSVPEPATGAMLAAGALTLATLGRRRQRR